MVKENTNNQLMKRKKMVRKEKRGSNVDMSKLSQTITKANSKKKAKENKDKLRKKRKIHEKNEAPVDDQTGTNNLDGLEEQTGKSKKAKKKTKKYHGSAKDGEKLLGKNREAEENKVYHLSSGDEDCSRGTKNDTVPCQSHLDGNECADEVDNGAAIRNRKSKKAKKKTKKFHGSPKAGEKFPEKTREAEESEVYHISSGDEDCSRGMKKWVTDYYNSRPGLEVLQERIDDFITAHEEQLEQERKDREAQAAEGGWTVVVHHKGRKKTTDSESGIAVGSVSQAAVEGKMANKKPKEIVAQDFYRFQKREAHRSEIMMLRSKFEQDRKRIQQLRAARKFKPY